MLRFFVYILYIILPLCIWSQNSGAFAYSFALGGGYVVGTTDFLRGDNVDNKNIDKAFCVSAEMRTTLSGKKAWHHYYNSLHYGFGISYSHLNYSKKLGNPFGVYTILGFSPLKTNRWTFMTDMAVGVSGIWEVYSETNRHNDVVSTPITAYAHAKATLEYSIANNWKMDFSLAFDHYSNGRIKKPNFGLNVLQTRLGLTFCPKHVIMQQSKDTLERYKGWNHIINIFYARRGIIAEPLKYPDLYDLGVKERELKQVSFPIFGANYRLQHRFSFSQSLGFGAEIAYNDSYAKDVYYFQNDEKDNLIFSDKIMASLFIGYEYHINKMSILLEPGLYLKKYSPSEQPIFWQKVGARYYLTQNFFAEITLRAYRFCVADFLQFSIGVRL